MKKYGLREKSTGEIIGYETSSNDGSDFCNETTVELAKNKGFSPGAAMWLVDDPRQAEYVRLYSTPWFNSNDQTPTHGDYFEPEDYEVVAVEIKVEVEPVDVSVPTPYEYYKKRYEDSDPNHWESMQRYFERGQDITYSWHDLKNGT